MSPALHRYVRYAEVAVVGALSIFAWVTYRDLDALRHAPVVLPNYEFEVAGGGDKDPVVRTRGTWVALAGPPEPLQTTSIECRKSRGECLESAAAVVFVGDKGILESVQTVFEIEKWGDSQIVTRPVKGRCATRTLILDVSSKRATSRISATEESAYCRASAEKTLDLVAGYKARRTPM